MTLIGFTERTRRLSLIVRAGALGVHYVFMCWLLDLKDGTGEMFDRVYAMALADLERGK
ncbi:MAG: hypothetical protein LBQ79_10335 [Deltaproteobacteria bacterium]|jgi:hypothetical protein|nr:hypothetical protein [Deltaproteobacteria bacterium]